MTRRLARAGMPAGGGPLTGTIDLRVRYAETDQMGVVYHANYLVWCEVGRTELIRSLGLPYAELERSGGVALAVADAALRYHAPARYDDAIRVVTTVSEVRSRTIAFEYQIIHAASGDRLVSARTTLVCLDRSGRPATLPPALRNALQAPSS
jgi:acyl-CoA thioester hydrolase